MKVIEVQNLSKKFNLVKDQPKYYSLREQINNFISYRIKKLGTRFKDSSLKEKQDFWALKDLTFDIQEGEAVGIIGNNGAGKSTLLKILSRITEPTTGNIKIQGRLSSLLEVGTGFHPELTGRENIYLNGSILGMNSKEIHHKLQEIVQFSELENFIDMPVKHYSSGMYTRLAFSVAASLEPEILIIDEVLAVGDVRFQKKCLGKMNDVASCGRTVLFVSHNMAAIQSFCKRAILIQEGSILEDGPSCQVIKTYLSKLSTARNFKEWPIQERPGNEVCKIISISCVDIDENRQNSYSISQKIKIIIKYEIIQEDAFAGFSIVVYKDPDECVFSSTNNSEMNFYGKPMPIGVYRTECIIPSNILNNGSYSITIIGFASMRTQFYKLDRCISFETYDEGLFTHDYFGNYSGCVRPPLEWKTCGDR